MSNFGMGDMNVAKQLRAGFESTGTFHSDNRRGGGNQVGSNRNTGSTAGYLDSARPGGHGVAAGRQPPMTGRQPPMAGRQPPMAGRQGPAGTTPTTRQTSLKDDFDIKPVIEFWGDAPTTKATAKLPTTTATAKLPTTTATAKPATTTAKPVVAREKVKEEDLRVITTSTAPKAPGGFVSPTEEFFGKLEKGQDFGGLLIPITDEDNYLPANTPPNPGPPVLSENMLALSTIDYAAYARTAKQKRSDAANDVTGIVPSGDQTPTINTQASPIANGFSGEDSGGNSSGVKTTAPSDNTEAADVGASHSPVPADAGGKPGQNGTAETDLEAKAASYFGLDFSNIGGRAKVVTRAQPAKPVVIKHADESNPFKMINEINEEGHSAIWFYQDAEAKPVALPAVPVENTEQKPEDLAPLPRFIRPCYAPTHHGGVRQPTTTCKTNMTPPRRFGASPPRTSGSGHKCNCSQRCPVHNHASSPAGH